MQKSIIVDLPSFTITVSEYDEPVRTMRDFSVGRDGHRTPLLSGGSLSLEKRRREYRSNRYPPPNGGARMDFALFFEQDLACAFHEGDPAVPSHGCIHLASPDARWLFEWAGSSPVGLDIVGPYPVSPVARQRVYRMGAPNMLSAKIAEIQQALLSAGFDPNGVDGDFLVGTDEAVRAFQAAHGLMVDGKVGRDTARELGVEL